MKKFLLACRRCGLYTESYKIVTDVDYFADDHSVKITLVCKGCGAREVFMRKKKLKVKK